jgi:hypothetical protein
MGGWGTYLLRLLKMLVRGVPMIREDDDDDVVVVVWISGFLSSSKGHKEAVSHTVSVSILVRMGKGRT